MNQLTAKQLIIILTTLCLFAILYKRILIRRIRDQAQKINQNLEREQKEKETQILRANFPAWTTSKNLAKNLTNQIKVLIAAEYRGGSTFAGEIFNQNPEASYIFEPLYMIRRFPKTISTQFPKEFKQETKQLEVLENIFRNCSYPDKRKYLMDLPWFQGFNEGLSKRSRKDPDFLNCNLGDTCFYWKNREMMDLLSITIEKSSGNLPENFPLSIEQRDHSYNYQDSLPILNQINSLWTNKCLTLSKIIAAKVILLEDLSIISKSYSLANDQNFYIIYLIRDPRAMFNSRLKAVRDWAGKANPRPNGKPRPASKATAEWSKRNIRLQCENFKKNLDFIDRMKNSKQENSRQFGHRIQ